MRYCSPAILYLVISIFSIILACFMNVLPIFILTKIVFTLLWVWFLNFLCVKGYKRVSWILVLIPYMIIIMNIFILLTTDVCVEEGFVEGRTGRHGAGPLNTLFSKKKKNKNNAEKEEEARKKEEDARKKEEEARKKEEKARKREEKARKREEKARKKEEKARKKEAEDKAKREADETTDETPDNAISTTYSPYQRQPTYVEDPEDW